ncbi:DUF6225 family protein [Actinoplanes sp. G11-F43]|uniref:DUF6225 family protein n=1 Tax=Actinoplanes sp. G11-F43 TaxID=3424130 RepID=UPI003D33AF36
MLTPEQHAALRAQMIEVFGTVAVSVLEVADRDAVAALRRGTTSEARRAHVAEVAIAMAAAGFAEEWAKTEATAAAKAGASYTELGTAAGITRQGARSRWPGLADLATAARRAGRAPAARPTQREVGRGPVGRHEIEIEFEHTVTAWTVGDLRRALQPVPGDMPVMALTAEKPGGEFDGDTQVVRGTFLSASPVVAENGRMRFVLVLDHPTGTYNRLTSNGRGYKVRGEEYEHRVEPVTVAGLLAAIAEHPDDMPLLAWLADEPGDENGDEQIVYDGEIGQDWVPPVRGEREGEWVPGHHFDLQLEFKPGRYLRYEHRPDDDA